MRGDRCTATRTDGQPCQAFTFRQGPFCVMHEPSVHNEVRPGIPRGKSMVAPEIVDVLWVAIRGHKRLTLGQCADALGVNRYTLRRWLNGTHLPQRQHEEAIHQFAEAALWR